VDGPRGPLVVRFGAMGDLINLTSMLQTLATAWGAPCDVVTGRDAPATVVAGVKAVGEVRALRSRRTPYALSPEQRRLAGWLRRRGRGPDWVVGERDPASLVRLLDRGGVDAARRVASRDHPRGPLEHIVDYQHRLARLAPAAWPAAAAAAVPIEPPAPRLAVSDDEIADCRRWLAGRGWRGQPLVVLQPEARKLDRGRWPHGKWRQAVAAVLDSLPDGWALVAGTAAERRRTAALARTAAHPRLHDVAGELPMRRLLALLTLAHSAISVDTGPAHAAAALGCPLVVLMGTAEPRRNRPWGPPERVAVVAQWPVERWPDSPEQWWHRHDMAAIPVAAVVEAWERVAAARPAATAEPAPVLAAAPAPGRLP
jgi:heptosyltransferase-2/heptosyltransferase-3